MSASGPAPEAERREIHLDLFAVQFDRLLDCLGRKRQRADLIAVADHDHIAAYRPAEQLRCNPGRVNELTHFVTGRRRNRPLDAFQRQGKICVARKIARHVLKAVHDDLCPRLECTEHLFGG